MRFPKVSRKPSESQTPKPINSIIEMVFSDPGISKVNVWIEFLLNLFQGWVLIARPGGSTA
jgi:hypothetical protein